MNPIKFTASTSWATAMAGLDTEIRCHVYDAVFSFIETGKEPHLTGKAAVAFSFIRIDLDLEMEKAERLRKQRLAAINKRWSKTKESKTKA